MICGVFMSRKKTLTEADRRQKQQASRTHGLYAVRDRGEAAMTNPQRSRLQEIKEQLESAEGIRQMMQERTANAILLVELATSYVADEHKAGIPLDEIKVLKALPAFMNTAHRQIRDLLDVMPADVVESAELARIKEVLDAAE
jgi:hypothetical protein